jgi:cyanophycinase-like exopeptidase
MRFDLLNQMKAILGLIQKRSAAFQKYLTQLILKLFKRLNSWYLLPDSWLCIHFLLNSTFKMMKNLTLFAALFPFAGVAQDYTSYFTGNPVDAVTQPGGGICLMGGATEDDNAMTWFLEQANGGDILVIRTSGSDGYNDYFYTDLGVTVNSVESIVFHNAAASDDAYIHQKIEQAEAIWIAGGNQWNYVSFWRDTPIDSLINEAITDRKIVIGGTSAGMAILGEIYFTAENGTVTSATALNNPYSTAVTIDSADFLNVPYMQGVITDTHYDNPDRRGRHVVFMARAMEDFGFNFPRGIACEEYVAVCVDTSGIARVYGGYPAYDEQAYFIQVNCNFAADPFPEVCTDLNPMTWSHGGNVLVAYKVNGTAAGANYLDLNTWKDGSGGTWEYWAVNDGVLTVTPTPEFGCDLSAENTSTNPRGGISVYPNPVATSFTISTPGSTPLDKITIYDLSGRIVFSLQNIPVNAIIPTGHLLPGVYLITIETAGIWSTVKFVME